MPGDNIQGLKARLEMLITRLERISADSIWAHRASGYRGTLLRWLDKLNQEARAGSSPSQMEIETLVELLDTAFELLERAAKEQLGAQK